VHSARHGASAASRCDAPRLEQEGEERGARLVFVTLTSPQGEGTLWRAQEPRRGLLQAGVLPAPVSATSSAPAQPPPPAMLRAPPPPADDSTLLSQATSTDTSKSEKRTQAKTGIAFAVLFLVGAAVGGFFWHRHKRAAHQREYAAMERVTEMQ